MVLMGQVWKEGKWWAAEVPAAGVHTQGRTRKDAAAMIADAIESIINRPGFKVSVTDLGASDDGVVSVAVEASDTAALAAYVLKVQRELHGLTLVQAAEALGQSSKNSYARYEQGRAVPTIDKFAELLAAVAPELTLTIGTRRR